MKEKLEKIDKKILIMGGTFLIVIIVLIFGGALLYNKLFFKSSYEDVENIMLEAAKSYLNDNSEKLPLNVNDNISIPVDTLVDAEEMNTLESYLREDENTCSGEVTVTNVNGEDYRYAVFLDCGEDKHQTIKFVDYINENVEIVNDGNGLYDLNGELVYRGDNVDNYITFSGKTYRIVKFAQEHPVIIYTEKMDSVVWDDRYNVDKEDNSGINDYEISRIKDSLNELYKGTTLVAEADKLLVSAHDIGIGRRNSKDTDKSGSLENAELLKNQYIGLLQVNDYLNASTDRNCIETTSPSCVNYNYLSKYTYNWWTVTASSLNSYKVFRIGGSSEAKIASTNSNGYLRPVFYLVKDAIYVSGNGTKESPYVIK